MNVLHDVWEKLLKERTMRLGDEKRKDAWRPKIHIAPPFGWLNDPNGLCQYKGVYHAFYQFSPFQAEGGLKFWGHCTSRDLLHWEYEGVPLKPDQKYDCHGVYSGSALVEDDEMYLFYTANVKHEGAYDYIHTGRESNTVLAVSADGMHVDTKELLMTNADYPKDVTLHVRDPKVWKQEGIYYMVQGARTKGDKGAALLFASDDKRHWKCIHRLESEDNFGYMWECPDIYRLDGKVVFSISPQGVEAQGLHYQNKYQSVACFLEEDFRTASIQRGFWELDGGFDFYAPQTFLSEDGRRIQIGWMGIPDVEEYSNCETAKEGWQNVLTLPRELSIKDGNFCQNPVKELSAWWNHEEAFEGDYQRQTDTCYELEVIPENENVRITLARGLELRYEKEEGIFWMEFTDALLGAGRSIRGRNVRRLFKIQVLVDVSCVEVFLNDGEDVFSSRFYPQAGRYEAAVWGSSVRGYYRHHVEK